MSDIYEKPKTYQIIVPVYKTSLSHNETLVINNLKQLYNSLDITIISPESLELPSLVSEFKVERFHNSYFKDIKGYNRLLMNHEFYCRFSSIQFILIHQLDAFLFRNELDYWCDQNYDYIGAPWLRDDRFLIKLFRNRRVKKREIIFNKVGNGGLSLRKVSTFVDFFKKNSRIVKINSENELFGIEDVFWSIIAPKHVDFKIPDLKTAAKFALDRKPELGMKLNNFDLPFGCHGFEKNKTKRFWKNYIPELS